LIGLSVVLVEVFLKLQIAMCMYASDVTTQAVSPLAACGYACGSSRTLVLPFYATVCSCRQQMNMVMKRLTQAAAVEAAPSFS